MPYDESTAPLPATASVFFVSDPAYGESHTFELCFGEARGSKKVQDLASLPAETTEGGGRFEIDITGNSAEEVALMVKFLKLRYAAEVVYNEGLLSASSDIERSLVRDDRFKRLERPLLKPDLHDAGVPMWACEFFSSVGLERMPMLWDMGTTWRILMLHAGAAATIASAVVVLGGARFQLALRGALMSEDEEEEVKEANPWAWEEDYPPYVDEDYEDSSAAVPSAPAPNPA